MASLETREEVDAPSQAEQALSSRTQVLPASAYCPSACCPPALLPASPYYPCAPPTTPPLRLSLAYSSAYPSAYRPLQDINVVFDAPKYTHTMKLRAFYAVPKMVVIPSGTSLGKRKLRQAADSTRAMLALRTQLVSQMLGRGEVRGRLSTQHNTWDPPLCRLASRCAYRDCTYYG